MERDVHPAPGSNRVEARSTSSDTAWSRLMAAHPPPSDGPPLADLLPPYGELVRLNTSGEVLAAVGEEVLASIAEDYMELLGTSTAVYETSGDYALGIVTSEWCRFMDAASHRLCGSADPREALASGRWHCHESCWKASRDAMESGGEADVPCEGGVRLFAVPILVGEEVVGSINFGYGDPPRDPERLAELASHYGVAVEELRAQAAAYTPPAPEVVRVAKRRLRTSARLIGEVVARSRAESALREQNRTLEAEVARREEAERGLREANEKLSNLLQAAPLPVIALDLEGRVLSWNAAAERTFGWTEAEVRGEVNPIIPRERTDEACALREEVAHRPAMGVETDRQRKDGSRIQVSVSTAPLFDSGGATTGMILLLEDITARKDAEEALRATESQFRFLADAVPQQIWVTRPDGYHEYYNQRWYDFTGLSLAESEGDGWNAALHPDDQQRAWDRWNLSLSTGEPYEIEYRFRRHDGQYRWFLGQALPQRDDGGEIVRWFGTLTDIHERFEAAAERERLLHQLMRSEERYALVAQATSDVIWDWDLTTHELFWNEAMEATFGHARDAESQRIEFWSARIHPDDRDRAVGSIHAVIDGGETSWTCEYRFERADGSYATVLDRGFVAHDAAGKPTRMIGSMLDLSERERLLVSERRARAEAEAANRAKADFLAAMSHELRTPLNAIGGYTDLLDLGIHGPTTEAQDAALGRIRANQQHLLTLITDVLSFAKLEAGQIEIDVQLLAARDVLAGVEPLVGSLASAKGIALSVEQPDPSLHLLGDEERVRQILLNLVGNAIKFTQEGGWVALSCEARDEWAQIRVVDNGPGIDEQKQQRIFDPFIQVDRRLDRPGDGVGLGLAISRDLVRAMGGELNVESAPGRGSTFTVVLPRG
jgi:PAS domain S-box-containing protein